MVGEERERKNMPATATQISDPCSEWLSRNTMTFDEVQGNLGECMERAQNTHSPVVITRDGQATSLLIDLKDLDAFLEAERVREAVRLGEAEADAGLGIPHEEFVRLVREKFDDRAVLS